jgi:hypothetical protein
MQHNCYYVVFRKFYKKFNLFFYISSKIRIIYIANKNGHPDPLHKNPEFLTEDFETVPYGLPYGYSPIWGLYFL